METVLQNLDTRLLRVEQILPTLPTKTDLDQAETRLRGEIAKSEAALRDEMVKSEAGLREVILKSEAVLRGGIDRSSNQLRVLIEANRSDNQRLAEHVLEILTRLRDER
jgi:hypothetical protein